MFVSVWYAICYKSIMISADLDNPSPEHTQFPFSDEKMIAVQPHKLAPSRRLEPAPHLISDTSHYAVRGGK